MYKEALQNKSRVDIIYHELSKFKESGLSVFGPIIPTCTSQRYQYFIIYKKSVTKIVTAKPP